MYKFNLAKSLRSVLTCHKTYQGKIDISVVAEGALFGIEGN